MNHKVDVCIRYGCKVFIDLYYFGIQQVLYGIGIEYTLDHRSCGGVVLNWRQNFSATTAKTNDHETKNHCVDDVLYIWLFGHVRGAVGDTLGDIILYADQKEIW